ncbi:putative transferase, protein kinase RLK-Pelle-RLCK-VIIa-2 family [Helianthus annuus]|nr:putative transferase, protein kinase RLK-Pelle-RLCK-VIIa-2 family [Helianthus annuus]KAJ0707706.1 putative transferase, protein kinase RLK-Pelle-RLCK-VIIa-2 family [Helianthus annuus]KAJ0711689.1 putative transferase, protein kinase RLK-Pelle-RLCK-VIIa-2 family [Helianthus annuus]
MRLSTLNYVIMALFLLAIDGNVIPKCAGHLYVKSDVYGFGVVLLELMTGLRALDTKRPGPQTNLVEWAKPLLPNRKKLKTIMDARIEGQYSSKGAIMLAQVILHCLEQEPRKRPAMKEVADILEQIYAIKVKT